LRKNYDESENTCGVEEGEEGEDEEDEFENKTDELLS